MLGKSQHRVIRAVNTGAVHERRWCPQSPGERGTRHKAVHS